MTDDMHNGFIYTDEIGTKRYYLYDGITLHNEHGPAVDYKNGSKYWYVNGERHREDGPAAIVFYEDGSMDEYFYFNGRQLFDLKELERIVNLKAFL